MTYEQLSQMYEPNDPKLWSMLDEPNWGEEEALGNLALEREERAASEDTYDFTEADLYPEEYVSGVEDGLSDDTLGGSE
jgi:hypothetical protein